MTSRERLLASIRHEEPDRVPISPRIHAWLGEYYGDASLSTYLRFCEEFGCDAFWCQGNPNPNYIYSWTGNYNLPEVKVDEIREQDNEYTIIKRVFNTPAGALSDAVRIPPARNRWGIYPDPLITEHLVKSKDDIERLRYLIPPLQHGHDAYHQSKDTIRDKGLIELYIHGVLDCRAGDARGLSRLMIDYYDDSSLFKQLMDLFHKRMMDETKVALEDSVDIIFGSWFYESLSAGWSPKLWREIFFPRLKEQIELVHSARALYHHYDDGKLTDILPLLVEAGVDILSTCTPSPMGDFDLAESKRKFGSSICFKGYIDLLYVVKNGTPESIEKAVRDAIEIGKHGGGFILGSSDSFRDGTPVENVRAYFDAALMYG
jgi:hypothetical protein